MMERNKNTSENVRRDRQWEIDKDDKTHMDSETG